MRIQVIKESVFGEEDYGCIEVAQIPHKDDYLIIRGTEYVIDRTVLLHTPKGDSLPVVVAKVYLEGEMGIPG
jgi:hypothetical protein